MTCVHHNPDSWEGWYWGAVHHWGYTLRVGQWKPTARSKTACRIAT